MNIKYQILGFFSALIIMSLVSCQSSEGNQTGSEYMPDMAHSVAYEANTYGYYYNNRWGTKEELHAMVQPRLPIAGTIARGYAGHVTNDGSTRGISYKANGSVPYYYADTEEDRTRATAELINNPYPITKAGLESGKNLYNIQCAICHGEKGDGAGYLVRDDGGKYPVQPAIFTLPELITASNGRYYHAIMYGKNLMGGYSDKLSYEERWDVIHYIRALQAASTKTEYSETVNTLNNIDIPAATLKKAIVEEAMEHIGEAVVTKEEHHTEGGHH
jgi:mono/diheme cytochrome c family protein